MEKLIENTGEILFSCGCQGWCIHPNDEKGVTEQPNGTVIDHDCSKITVFRIHKGIKRFFLKK